MNNLVKRMLVAGLGMLLVLGWWTIQGKRDGASASASSAKIPAKLWEGGGAMVTVEVESTDPTIFRAYFTASDQSSPRTPVRSPVRSMDAFEKIDAGKHSWTIDVPMGVGGSLELQASAPKPGSKLSWTVRAGDKVIAQDAETLSQPLQGNEAFFLHVEVDDFAAGET